MEVEQLDLNNFDLNTHEPPNYKECFESVDYNEDNELELNNDTVSSCEEYSDTEDEVDDEYEYEDNKENIEINIDNEEDDIDMEECDNVIYSYPFFSKNDIDYEYRVTISDEELLLEQVKCDDNQIDFDECVEVFAEIYRGELGPSFELITKNIDLRDKKSVLQEGIIDYNFDDCNRDKEKLKQKIENNKISVLFELYKEIVESVYE
jgi:hypothetical protein|tara:strand:+ start:654 stop:1274 length:621 start_codon:yes stop_codon:yes gene_type:complete